MKFHGDYLILYEFMISLGLPGTVPKQSWVMFCKFPKKGKFSIYLNKIK
jgi:hypothetical protein